MKLDTRVHTSYSANSRTPPLSHLTRTAVFADNDFGKVNGVTTTWRAVLERADTPGDVKIYTASDDAADLPDYFSVPSIGCGLPWYHDMRVYLPRLRQFARRLRSDRVSVIHVATPGPVGMAGRWLARRLGLPLVGSYHTQMGDYVQALSGSARLGRGVDLGLRWFYGPCSTVLVPSEATREQLVAQGYRADRLRIWPRGVDADRFTPEWRSQAHRRAWRVDERRPAILYAGRLSAEKGLSIIEAIQTRLHRRAIAHRFIFAGDGPMRSRLMRECGEAAFLGALSHTSMAEVMASADMFLFPSATDTFGNVVLEAQASGLPVVVSDRGGPHQQMLDGVTGRVCRAEDADAFADAVIALTRDAGRRQAMGLAARQLAMERQWSVAVRPLYAAWDDARRRTSEPRGASPLSPSPVTAC